MLLAASRGGDTVRATRKGAAVAATVAVIFVAASGLATEAMHSSSYWAPGAVDPGSDGNHVSRSSEEQEEILWIFDEDFEDPYTNDWVSRDLSGTAAQENYWHHSDIRPKTGPDDTSWWCGTHDHCWVQPRGYANDWYQVLSQHLTGVTGTGTETVEIDFDQRYAMERGYDFGYVDISDDGGVSWVTLAAYTNTGTSGAGTPVDWDDATYGHVLLDASSYSGSDIDLRFRFESDRAFSSADEPSAPPYPVTDGAWQIDNIRITVDGTPTFVDDCESGEGGWIHDGFPGSGETGVVWLRGQYAVDFDTGLHHCCEDRNPGEWMYAAVDPLSSMMIDGEYTSLTSPPIDICGADRLIAEWDMWVDLPEGSGDYFDIWVASGDDHDCIQDPTAAFVDEEPGCWYGGPLWGTWQDDWTAFAGNDWLGARWKVFHEESASIPAVGHRAGVFLNRFRVGLLSGTDTVFDRDIWNSFNDWFIDDLGEAVVDTAWIRVSDAQDVDELYLLASNDEGTSWDVYSCLRTAPASDWWKVPPPVNQMTARSEIHYYYEALDGHGNVAVFPEDAPDDYFEMSILPINATELEPGILLVDKHGRFDPGERGDYLHTTEYYYCEALGILGYDWDIYDVEVPSGCFLSGGPNVAAMKSHQSSSVRYPGEGEMSCGPTPDHMRYYGTIIYWMNDFDAYTLWDIEQRWLIDWLSEAPVKERNLLLTGNDISYELKAKGREVQGFHDIWLAADYAGEVVGHGAHSCYVDSVPGLADFAGGWTFMDNDGGECILAGACPDPIENFDFIVPAEGIAGVEIVADYIYEFGLSDGAGVAYTHPTMGYQTIILGFGMEFMMDGVYGAGASNYSPEGYYHSGIGDRVNLMGNIMGYFDETPEGVGTGVVEGSYKNAMSQAYPNPFNPVTRIAYSIKEAGPVAIEIYNVAGKVVRTLLDAELDAGATGEVVWNGANDLGEKCASGVYFYRIDAPSFTSSKKVLLLK